MLDIALIRSDPAAVRSALARRGIDPPVDRVLELDRQRRALQTRIDEERARQKQESARVRDLAGDDKQKLLDEMKALSEEIKSLAAQEEEIGAQLRQLLVEIPNLPHESVPDGVGEESYLEVRTVGLPPAFDFEVKDHLEIGQALDGIDVERAARASGSRFAYLKGQVALLELALVRFALDRLTAHGFTPVVTPALVQRSTMEATGALMAGEQQIYRTGEDDLYLIGTAEVTLAALHRDEFIDAASLPIRYAGFSSCFRREAGTYGKDMRGIFRVHQFDKVEMFSFTSEEQSWDEHEFLLAREEEILQELEIPYRVMLLCAGDLYGPSAKTYDIEAWLPGQAMYREITSCSNCTDYQARRLGTKTKTSSGSRPVHTLNGTAVTSSRTIIALIENHQQADGSVAIPDALRRYTGFDKIGR
jgi:seryl-tRNA synthetase